MAGVPWLSVVLPTYNGAAHLPAALEGLRAQGDARMEIIAIDDGSTDDTLSLLEAAARSLPLQVVRREHVGNWVANTNYGLSLARGRWACLLHQDDVWLPNRLAVLREAVAARPEATLVLHPSWYIDDRGRRLGKWRCPLPVRDGLVGRRLVLDRLLVQNFIALPAPLFRRDTALEVGGLQEDLWYTADWDFWLKLAAVSRTAYLPTPLTAFRIHPLSQTVRRSRSSEDFRGQLDRVLEKRLKAASGGGLAEVARFSARVNVFLAATSHGSRADRLGLLLAFLSLGPAGWHRYLRDSRIVDRVSARLRAGLLGPRAAAATLAAAARTGAEKIELGCS